MKLEKPLIIVAMPAYNESQVIAEVIKDVKTNGFENVLVVNDGSKDNTSEVCESAGAMVCSHLINRGAGAAKTTAIHVAKMMKADYLLMMDSDGQHLAKDLKNVLKELQTDEVDFILGSRFLHRQSIPFIKYYLNKLANFVTYVLYGVKYSDCNSGLRGYNRQAIEKIETKGDGYDFELEILLEVKKKGLRSKEIPIDVLYTEYSQSKPVRATFFAGVKVFWKMIVKIFTSK